MKKLLAVGFCLLGALFAVQAQGINWKEYGAGIKEGDFIVHGDIGVTAHSESLPYDGSLKVPYLEASVEYTKKPAGFLLDSADLSDMRRTEWMKASRGIMESISGKAR